MVYCVHDDAKNLLPARQHVLQKAFATNLPVLNAVFVLLVQMSCKEPHLGLACILVLSALLEDELVL